MHKLKNYVEMMHNTEFLNAGFVILKVVEKLKHNKFFKKKENIFLPWKSFFDANNQFSNLLQHLL